MSSKLAASTIIFAIICLTATFLAYPSLLAPSGGETISPKDGSPYIWTPIDTRSENINWANLQNGLSWTESYSDDAYQNWLNVFLEPAFVRDYTMLYLRTILELNVPNPLTLDWAGGRETPEGILGWEDYVYRAESIVVTISYPVVLPEETTYSIKVEVEDSTIWEGTLHRRQFFKNIQPSENKVKTVYNYYGGVSLFDRGIHIIATDCDPTTFAHEFEIVNDYWRLLKEKETVKASSEDFINIIISRGDRSTGGYAIQVKSFSWLESYPVQFRFAVNFTDPGEGVYVTEAFTNPLVLVPIGKLQPGEYVVEVHIVQYILTFDEQENPVYTPLQTFAEEVWKQAFTIE
ncbi:MAG: protease complex subunit PrcB family protein [Candidatus Bathyarchaeota archaeon]|nr:protease complex subunit PrcB family protein [Candidatus Bathyarchaeota archaeon]